MLAQCWPNVGPFRSVLLAHTDKARGCYKVGWIVLIRARQGRKACSLASGGGGGQVSEFYKFTGGEGGLFSMRGFEK